MTRRLAFALWLAALWVVLWEEPTPANVLSGLLVAGALVIAFPPTTTRAGGRVRPLAAARFVGYFAWKLAEASAIVAWEVVTPPNRINEGIVAIPVRGVSDALTTVVANAISLTPGTLTLEVDLEPTVLYVHVLHLRDVEAVRKEARHLEALAIRAFGTDEAVRRLGGEGRGSPGPAAQAEDRP